MRRRVVARSCSDETLLEEGVSKQGKGCQRGRELKASRHVGETMTAGVQVARKDEEKKRGNARDDDITENASCLRLTPLNVGLISTSHLDGWGHPEIVSVKNELAQGRSNAVTGEGSPSKVLREDKTRVRRKGPPKPLRVEVVKQVLYLDRKH